MAGILRFKANAFQPHSMTVSSIDVHEIDDDLPSLLSLRGIAPEATREDSADFVRKLRDAW